MPTAKIRGVTLNYEILGDGGPFVALQPGGRRAGASLRSLAQKIAEAGNRVVIYDRRNTGASEHRDRRRVGKPGMGRRPARAVARNRRPAGLCRRQLVGVPAGAAAGVAAPGGGARAVAVAGHRRGARGRAPDEPVLHLAYRGGAARRHGRGLQARPLERGDRDQPEGARRADGVRRAGFRHPDGALAAGFPGRRRPPGDRPLPGRTALDDDAGLHRSGHGPGASAARRARRRTG